MTYLLFAFFGMWETTLAVGAGAVSIPIIIHLLNRRRYRVVTWAAMKFLLAAQKQNTRKMRLEQIILLAVRTLIILLIVLAMASVMNWAEDVWGYFWPEGAGFVTVRTGRTHKVVVLDGSLSMNLQQGEKTSFDKAKTLAADLVRRAQSGDGFSVVLMKDAPVWVVAEPSQDSRSVAGEIELLRPAQGNASVEATLNMIASKLAETTGRYQRREVYFFTDLQKATWQAGGQSNRPAAGPEGKEPQENSSLKAIQKQATTVFVDVGHDAGNITVSDVRLGASLVTTGALVPVSATLQNYSTQPAQNVRVELLVGRARETANDGSLSLKSAAEILIDLKPNEQGTVNFAARFATPGQYAVQVRAQGDDLKADDARTIIVTVKETVPVMLVNGKPAVDPFDQATEYVKLALNPFPQGAIPALAPIRPRTVTVAQFADANEGDLNDVDCVFLCDVKRLGTGELRRLQTHLRRGGGVVISVGDHFAENLEEHNRVLYKDGRGLLPAKLVKKIEAPAEHFFHLHGTDDAFREPPLKEFADSDDRVSLTTAHFRVHLQVDPPKDVQAKTILTFMPDLEPLSKAAMDKTLPTKDPALIAWNPPIVDNDTDKSLKKETTKPARRYRGNVVLVTTTLNMDWHSWPGSPSYAAMMQELVRYAVAGRLREQSSVVGEVIEMVLPADGNEVNVALRYPDESGRKPETVRTKLTDDVNIFRSGETDWSGVYRLTVQGETKEHLFAVNVPSSTPDQSGSESDLGRLDAEKLKEVYPDWDFQVVDHPRGARITPRADEVQVIQGKLGPAIAHYMLLAVLVLLFVEMVLAWAFGHHSAVAGATEPPRAGPWPAIIASISAIVFLLGAGVLVHAAYTGDFLGFMPDEFRRGVERSMDIQPPAPGEGTRWQLEFQNVLSDAGDDLWWGVALSIAAVVLLIFVYRSEPDRVGAAYKIVLGGLRMFIILVAMAVLLPQLQLRFDRQTWPNIAVVIDDSRSMGEPDHYRDDRVREAVATLSKQIQDQLTKQRLPEKLKVLNEKVAQKSVANDEASKLEVERLKAEIRAVKADLDQLGSPNWQPTRLQIAQGIIGQQNQDWLEFLLHKRHMKVHVFHLDAAGRAIRLSDAQGKAGEITHPDDVEALARAKKAAADLQPSGDESRLGGAIRQVLDYYKGGSLAGVIMLSDGVTTRDESISQVGSYAKLRGVPLFFVGIGDDQEIRDLKLHDLQVEDTVYVGDRVIFQARLTGEGYKDPVAVILKEKQKDGSEKEVDRTIIKLTPQNKSERVMLRHRPEEAGRKMFIIEVKPENEDPNQKQEKIENVASARLEREIDVLENKLIKVLFVEQFPRYEFRFIKSLLEREAEDAQNKRSIELKVVLLDADADFPAQDRTALPDFPATRQELDQYDVVILGDVDPHGQRMGDQRLRMLADFVRGEDESGKKLRKTGGGLLMLAGTNFNPHSYRNTPLAAVLPIEPNAQPPLEPEEILEDDKYQVQMTAIGREHPIFRFSPTDAENQQIWEHLPGLFWYARGYRIKPLAEVLAVHPTQKAEGKIGGQDPRHPLVVQQFVGSGRTMFFGFEESWRWRLREDEVRFNQFWIQTVRYLSRTRLSRTVVRLDRQTPYRLGEPIKVTVRFPDNVPLPDKQKTDKLAPASDVTVIVEHRPPGADEGKADAEIQTMKLAKMEGSWGTFEGLLKRTREGKYRFWLSNPDVSKEDPNGQKPSAEARVELPPGELDRLRMDQHEMVEASKATQGGFYTIDVANQLLEDLPSGFRVSLNTPRPPYRMWNHALMFLLVLGLLSSEWLLRKRKHLL